MLVLLSAYNLVIDRERILTEPKCEKSSLTPEGQKLALPINSESHGRIELSHAAKTTSLQASQSPPMRYVLLGNGYHGNHAVRFQRQKL